MQDTEVILVDPEKIKADRLLQITEAVEVRLVTESDDDFDDLTEV